MPTETYDEIMAIPDRFERIKAFTHFLEMRETDLQMMRRVRDNDIRELIDEIGPSETSRRIGLSLTTIKNIRGRA